MILFRLVRLLRFSLPFRSLESSGPYFALRAVFLSSCASVAFRTSVFFTDLILRQAVTLNLMMKRHSMSVFCPAK